MAGVPPTLTVDQNGKTVFNHMRERSGEWGRENNEIKLLLEVMNTYLRLKEQEHCDKNTYAGRKTLDFLSGPISDGSTMTILSHAVNEGYDSLCRKLVALINASAWECSLKKFTTADGSLVERPLKDGKDKDESYGETLRQARRQRHIKTISTTQNSWIEGSVSMRK